MTIPIPAPPVIPGVVGPPVFDDPYTNIAPFTIRDSATYLAQVETIIAWIKGIVPQIDSNNAALIEAWVEQTTQIVNDVNTALASQADEVNTALLEQLNTVNTALADQLATVTQQLTDQSAEVNQLLTDNVNFINAVSADLETQIAQNNANMEAAVDTILANGPELQDPVVTAIAQDPDSQFAGELSKYVRGKQIDLNIARYGAVGDGVTDDTAAILSAFADFFDAGGAGRPARITGEPGKVYNFSESITLPLTKNFTGGTIDFGGAQLNYTGDNAYGFVADTRGSGRLWRDFRIKDLFLTNGGMRLESNNASDYSYGFIFDGLKIEGATEHGLFLNGPFEAVILHPRIGVGNSDTYNAINIVGGTSSIEIFGGVTRRGRNGLFYDGTDVDVYGLTTLDARAEGIQALNSRGNVISGVHVERCQAGKTDLSGTQPGIYMTGGGTIQGGYFYDWASAPDRRMTHAISLYASTTGPAVVQTPQVSNVPTAVRVNGAGAADVTLMGVPSYDVNSGYTGALHVLGKGDQTVNNRAIRVKRTLATETAMAVYSANEAEPRFSVDGAGRMGWHAFGSATPDVILQRATANRLDLATGDSFKLDGTWNGGHLIMGTVHYWNDATGKFRLKDGAPTSDTDGTIVGTQA